MRRQFNERDVRRLSDMPERTDEFVWTPHVENKQGVILLKPRRQHRWFDPRRRRRRAVKPAEQQLHGPIIRWSFKGLLPKEFLADRRRQTPGVGFRRHGARHVIRPRRKRSCLRFCRRWHGRASQLLNSRADHRKVVGSAGTGHVSSVRLSSEHGSLSRRLIISAGSLARVKSQMVRGPHRLALCGEPYIG